MPKNLRKVRQRVDGLVNLHTRKGTRDSKSGSNIFVGTGLLSGSLVRDIYNSGGIGAKVITRIADDITRKGFSIENDESGEVQREFDRLGGSDIFNRAIRWARAYGGSIITMRINDGRRADQPLRTDRIKAFEKLKVYEAGTSEIVSVKKKYDDPRKANYGEPEIYHVNTGNGIGLDIHETRVIRLEGRAVDTETTRVLEGWGGSELQPVYDSLMSMFSQLMSGEQVLEEMVIGVLKVENLDAMCVDSEGKALLQERIDLVDKSKNTENTLVTDINESYERHTVNLSGMSNLQQNAMTLVAGSADIPATFLYGSSPDGQNATGASDEKQYYGKIDAERKYFYKPALLKLLNLLGGGEGDLEITFPSLQTSNLYDTARALQHVFKGIKDLVDGGIITTEEAKKEVYDSKMLEKVSQLY